MMSKKYVAAAISLIMILVLVGGTISFFTTTGSAKNVVTASALNIKLVMLEDIDGVKSPVSGEMDIMPGETKMRSAQVQNTDKEPAWVRVRVEVVTPEGTKEISESDTFIIQGGNAENWEYDNGYFYYLKALEPGETTDALFDEIEMIPHGRSDNELSGKNINLNVIAEGTQVKNNGSSAKEAQGWPSV